MKQPRILAALACGLMIGATAPARAGAPTPDLRQGEFEHVCRGGPNQAQTCSVATQDADCPKSECVVATLSKTIKGTLTIVAHDTVTDWENGGATNQALTVMLEVKAPDGRKQVLAASYQNLADPTAAPRATSNVVSIDMDEAALKALSGALPGLLFVQPESTLSQQLQGLFSSNGTPVLVAVDDKRAQFADHTGDGLATVLRFKVKVQFVNPV